MMRKLRLRAGGTHGHGFTPDHHRHGWKAVNPSLTAWLSALLMVAGTLSFRRFHADSCYQTALVLAAIFVGAVALLLRLGVKTRNNRRIAGMAGVASSPARLLIEPELLAALAALSLFAIFTYVAVFDGVGAAKRAACTAVNWIDQANNDANGNVTPVSDSGMVAAAGNTGSAAQ